MVKPTPKREKLLRILSDNALTPGITKTKKAMMIEAGYSPKTANEPGAIMNSASFIASQQKALESFTRVRDLAVAASLRRIAKAPLNHLTQAADSAQKNIQLLTGHATEHRAIHISISGAIAEKNT